MKSQVLNRSIDRRTKLDQLQFKLVFIVVFSWFVFAEAMKVLSSSRDNTQQNWWKEALTQTNSVVPYLFMRV
ncbi:MAG TPA: hypothetical protein DDZ32_03015 [Gammaproteobacteria bacterium]|jgi:hypothetical protein|nr:hypothetical protein [Gammaproteobacteria bacterium]